MFEKTLKKRTTHLSAAQTIMAGFACMIFIGALLLNLPIASKSGESVGFINALFTATSANCVTGLVVVNTMAHWTLFGKAVLLLLIQIGGLGFMTLITAAMVLVRRKISLRSRQTIQTSFNQDNIGGMVRLVKRVVLITIVFQTAGAVLLTLVFLSSGTMSLPRAIGQGIFHAVSAFCNAGFDNIGTESLVPLQANIPFNFIIMALIIAGGLGFNVWTEIVRIIKNKERRSLRFRLRRLSLHTKIVFTITGILIFGGALFFLIIEWANPNTLGGMPIWEKIQASLFQSVTLRTAGFNTIPQDGLKEISQFVSCVLMLIGGSPSGTAGGIKTVTLGIIIISMISVIRGRSKLEAFGRSLPLDLLQKALSVASIMVIVVFVSATLLHFTELDNPYSHTFLDLLFETCSAAGTVGVTTGITPHLSDAGKIVLIICMYVGRLSPITVVVALNKKLRAGDDSIGLPEERVIIG